MSMTIQIFSDFARILHETLLNLTYE